MKLDSMYSLSLMHVSIISIIYALLALMISTIGMCEG